MKAVTTTVKLNIERCFGETSCGGSRYVFDHV